MSGGMEESALFQVKEETFTFSASKTQVGGGHYAKYAIQPSEFIHRNGIGFLPGNIIKYVIRYKDKNGREDLLKARHYIDLLLEWEYGSK